MSVATSKAQVLIVAKCIVNVFPNYSINSSKVFCKFIIFIITKLYYIRINSSKVYCKFIQAIKLMTFLTVLIVAKCIVNTEWYCAGKTTPKY